MNCIDFLEEWVVNRLRFRNILIAVIYFLLMSLNGLRLAASVPGMGGFTENKGQLQNPEGKALNTVFYYADFPGSRIYITEWGISYFFWRPDSVSPRELYNSSDKAGPDFHETQTAQWERMDLILDGAKLLKEMVQTKNSTNEELRFYMPQFSEGFRSAHYFSNLIFKDVYPGIDWELNYLGNEKGFKQNFIVRPGADYKAIQLRFEGPEEIQISAQATALQVVSKLGSVNETGLAVFSGETRISAEFEHIGPHTFQYNLLENWDQKYPLVIDPNVLVWGTYYGGSGFDYGNSSYSDGTSLWVAGSSVSVNFPCLNPGAGAFYQGTLNMNEDAWLVKFDLNGVRQWATYYGGSGIDRATSVHSNGTTVWVCGETSSANLPLCNPGGSAFFQGALSGATDAFIIAFNTSGQRQWASYYGGSGTDAALSLCSNGTSVWVTGNTTSADFPVQNPGGGAYYQSVFGGATDAFIIRFSSGYQRQYSTYYGGVDTDESHTLHLSGSSVFFGGFSASGNLPLQNPGGGAYFQNTQDGIDIFFVKMNTSGVRQWASFYGGNDDEKLHSVFFDGTSVWMTGYAVSTDFPLLNPGGGAYFQPTLSGADQTGFVLKFSATGQRQWASFYGGDVNSEGNSIFSNGSSVWIAGSSESSNFPTMDPGSPGFYQIHNSNLPSVISESWDVFILEFTIAGVRQWATYYGAEEDDFGNSICFDGNHLWVVGTAGSGSGLSLPDPGGGAYHQVVCGCGSGIPNLTEALILKFSALGVLEAQSFELSVEQVGSAIHINWDNVHPDHYHIEKSLDGISFKEIDILPANLHEYQEAVHQSGDVYYRIAADDISNIRRYSNIATIHAFVSPEYLLQTFSGSYNILNSAGDKLQLTLISSNGSTLLHLNSNERIIEINREILAPGMNLLRVSSMQSSKVFRLLK